MKFEGTEVAGFESAIRGMRNPMNSWAKSDSYVGIVDLGEDACEAEVAEGYACEELKRPLDYDDPKDLEVIEKYCDWLGKNGIIYRDPEYPDYASVVYIGKNDLDLMTRLIKSGSPHDKFLRQIHIAVDITAPLYWWKEMDTYKVGTTANSTSTMHKLASTPITLDCFETDDYDPKLIFEEGIDDSGDNPWPYECVLEDYIGESENKVYFSETLIGMLESLRLKYLETKDKRYWKELIRWLPESWLQTRTWTANYAILRNIIHWRTSHKLSEWKQFIDWCKTLPYSEELLFFNNVN